MSSLDKNEIIIALAGGIGVDLDMVSNKLRNLFEQNNYTIVNIQLTNLSIMKEKCFEDIKMHYLQRLFIKMNLGSQVRLENKSNDILVKHAIKKINKHRKIDLLSNKTLYIINQLKRPEEIKLLRQVYGRNFLLLSMYSSEENRKSRIEAIIHNEANSIRSNIKVPFNQDNLVNEFKDFTNICTEDINFGIQKLIHKDQEESNEFFSKNNVNYGQDLQSTYSHADYFVNIDDSSAKNSFDTQIERFFALLFRKNPFQEPTNIEYFMFMAQAASYRSTDKSRQVGCILVNNENEILSSGYNDVCKSGGGHYSLETFNDNRDFKLRIDFNNSRINEIMENIKKTIGNDISILKQIKKIIKNNVTEYMRATHAEMSAILDAARRGVSIHSSTAYVNTFPCHYCAKHMIAAGLQKIVFLHPYPKSSTLEMFKYELNAENDEHVKIVPFQGVSPEKFIYLFQGDQDARKKELKGEYNMEPIPPFLKYRNSDRYLEIEQNVIKEIKDT